MAFSSPTGICIASIVPVDHCEVVHNGRAVPTNRLASARTAADERGTLPLAASGWWVLRAASDRAECPVLDNYGHATTSPVYVSVAGKAPRSPADAAWCSAWIDRIREATERHADWNSPAEKAACSRGPRRCAPSTSACAERRGAGCVSRRRRLPRRGRHVAEQRVELANGRRPRRLGERDRELAIDLVLRQVR